MSVETLPKQVIALPRGVEPDGGPTLATKQVALTAVRYYEYHGADKILTPGGRSFMADDLDSGFSDGDAMRDIVLEKGVPESIVPHLEPSSDTITNGLTCKPHLDISAAIAVIAKQDQTPRGIWAVRFTTTANNIVSYPAIGEVSRMAILQEYGALLISKALFMGIQPGDSEAITKRNLTGQRLFSVRKSAVKRILACSSQYQ